MLRAMMPFFDKLTSIELGEQLFNECMEEFGGVAKVSLLHGDSGSLIRPVVAALDGPALFWLDAHYSKGETARADEDTPVRHELVAVLQDDANAHVILVDDARAFGDDPAYPSIDELAVLMKKHRPSYHLSVRADIVRMCPTRHNYR
jgi:hypothetical protein